jgi:hypothetical protein
MNAECKRLEEAKQPTMPWKKWGPYLSERQWGTVREDYSEGGNAWDYFSHDQARSRAYRWGEDGLAGISDDKQRLCFALALWNGKDPILKERLFGLTNSARNHGEDVKEYYFYLDSTPTHSYMKYLYKYPQGAFPYGNLVNTSRGRSWNEFEDEWLDTGKETIHVGRMGGQSARTPGDPTFWQSSQGALLTEGGTRPDLVPPISWRVKEECSADWVAKNRNFWPSSAASPVTAVLQST